MRFLKLVVYFYLNASIHVAFSVFAFLRITEIYFELPYNVNLNWFIFFGTITGYNFVKYAGVAKLHHTSLTRNLRIIQIFSFVCDSAIGILIRYFRFCVCALIFAYGPLALLNTSIILRI